LKNKPLSYIGKHFFFLIGIIIIVFLIKKAGVKHLITTVLTLSPVYLLLTIICWLGFLLLCAYRFKRCASLKLSNVKIFKIYLAGILLNYAAMVQGFGNIAKITLLKHNKVDVSQSTAGISLEMFYDIFFSVLYILVFAIFTQLNLFSLINVNGKVLIFIVFAAAVALLLFLIAVRKTKFVKKYFKFFRKGIEPKKVPEILTVTILIWCCAALMFVFLFKAQNYSLNFSVCMLANASAFAFGLITFIPGGLGVREAVVGIVLHYYNVPVETCISIALFNRFLGVAVVSMLLFFISLLERKPVRNV